MQIQKISDCFSKNQSTELSKMLLTKSNSNLLIPQIAT